MHRPRTATCDFLIAAQISEYSIAFLFRIRSSDSDRLTVVVLVQNHRFAKSSLTIGDWRLAISVTLNGLCPSAKPPFPFPSFSRRPFSAVQTILKIKMFTTPPPWISRVSTSWSKLKMDLSIADTSHTAESNDLTSYFIGLIR
jgi:hypothetical protein